jgi:hypothetical protein
MLQTLALLGRGISSSQGLYLNTGQYKQNKHTYQTSRPCVWFEPTVFPRSDACFRAREDSKCFRPLGYSDRPFRICLCICFPSFRSIFFSVSFFASIPISVVHKTRRLSDLVLYLLCFRFQLIFGSTAEKGAGIPFNKYQTYCFTLKTSPFLLPWALSRFLYWISHILGTRAVFPLIHAYI